MTNAQAASFMDWLKQIVSERRQLQALLKERFHALSLLADVKAAAKVDDRIRELVYRPLALTARERPNPHQLIDAIKVLPATFSSWRCDQDLRHGFDSPVGGVIVTNRSLQERLTALCGPFDRVVSGKLGAHGDL